MDTLGDYYKPYQKLGRCLLIWWIYGPKMKFSHNNQRDAQNAHKSETIQGTDLIFIPKMQDVLLHGISLTLTLF